MVSSLGALFALLAQFSADIAGSWAVLIPCGEIRSWQLPVLN
jgi:hypothetical protein